MKKTEKKKRFKLFDLNRDGKGVYKEENRKPPLAFFFILMFRKFGKLIRLNFIMLFQALPILGAVAIVIFGSTTFNTTDATYAPLYGISKVVDSPSIFNRLDLVSKQVEVPLFTPWMMIGIGLLALFLMITFGWQNVGAAYVLRGLFRGDAVFIVSDYFHGIKKNMKQAFFIGVIDFICSALLIYDIYVLWTSGSALMFGVIVAVAIIYIFMRFYIYQLLITFELKTLKLFKNALIFSVIGILRNLMALIGIVFLIVLHIALIFLLLPVGVSIPLVLPFFYLISLIGFISVYAAYPVIDKYMIAPYKASLEEKAAEESDAEESDAEGSDNIETEEVTEENTEN